MDQEIFSLTKQHKCFQEPLSLIPIDSLQHKMALRMIPIYNSNKLIVSPKLSKTLMIPLPSHDATTKEYHHDDTEWALQVSVKHKQTSTFMVVFDYLHPSLSCPEISENLVITVLIKGQISCLKLKKLAPISKP